VSDRIRWGLLATGAIAKAFARGVKASETGELAAVGSRSAEKARAFGAEFGIGRCYGSYPCFRRASPSLGTTGPIFVVSP